MDILKPDLIWIDNKCYRLNSPDTYFHENIEIDKKISTNFQQSKNLEDLEEFDMDEEYDEFEFELKSNGYYKTTFPVSQFYYGYIIGTRGSVKKQIELDTHTEITIPKSKTNNYLEICGRYRRDIGSAKRRINLIVQRARSKQQFTHFLSIPCNFQEIQKNFVDFKKTILEECTSLGIEESIFIRPEKLHITLGMLVLMDDNERNLANMTLQKFKQSIDLQFPMELKMHGIEYMNDDPNLINVLYAKVTPNNPKVIHNLIEELIENYVQTGLINNKFTIKLHMTLMNTKYRNENGTSNENLIQSNIRQPFDGREIIERFASYEFGTIRMKSIELSMRHATGPDGYYKVSGKIEF